MKRIVEDTAVSLNKRITNHSGRKTLVKKLKSAQIPESSIINWSHKYTRFMELRKW